MSDIEVRAGGYGKVKLQPSETKARYQRFCFVTKEVLGWITAYRTWLGTNSEYVFPGENGGWLQYDTVLDQIKALYHKIGLLDKPDKTEIYCIHSFRTFADSYMRNLGLDSKYVSAIIGHRNKLQSETHYLDWNQIEKSWVEKCSQTAFLTVQDTDSKKKIDRLENRNDKLELLLTKLLERMS
jgi:integrase